ncbi:hypothetical protein [Streptomyces sp. NPDC093260]|uniref:hypothetical protein n=1 Tax=Streptomyces sp. NPDC093260 TaxID=3155073 RepID=UPI003444C4A0
MKDTRRQQLALLPGVALAAALPGITLTDADGSPLLGYLLSLVIFAGVGTAIWSTPQSPRQAPVLLLILAIVGVTQDTLVWYLITWLSDVGVASVWSAITAAVVVRACCWAGVWLLPGAGRETDAAASP